MGCAMTEQEWLTYRNPMPMLKYLRDRASRRKLRLFGLNCCYHLRHILDHCGLKALDTAERYIEGLSNSDELEAARQAAYQAFYEFDNREGRESAASCIESLCFPDDDELYLDEITGVSAAEVASRHPRHLFRAMKRLAGLNQSRILRDIIGNPFRRTENDFEWSAWNDGTVPRLAKTIYDDRRFDLMPILADALEEAGCDEANMLDHCRGPGPHVRGCWVVDLLLGKE